jgi:hypothetical protein
MKKQKKSNTPANTKTPQRQLQKHMVKSNNKNKNKATQQQHTSKPHQQLQKHNCKKQ